MEGMGDRAYGIRVCVGGGVTWPMVCGGMGGGGSMALLPLDQALVTNHNSVLGLLYV